MIGFAVKNIIADKSVKVRNNSGQSGKNIGVCSKGQSAHAILNNVDIEAKNDGPVVGDTVGVLNYDGKLTITNSKIVTDALSLGMWSSAVACQSLGLQVADISNSVLESKSNVDNNEGWVETIYACDGSVSNSRLYAINGFDYNTGCNYCGSSGEMTIANTQIYVTRNPAAPDPGGNGPVGYGIVNGHVKVANSLVSYGIQPASGSTIRVFNSYDQNFNSIPNQ